MRKLLSLIIVVGLASLLLGAPLGAQNAAGERIHLINGVPDSKVDVSIGGSTAVEDFEFRDTQDLSSMGGEALDAVVVTDSASGDVLLDAGDVTLPDSGSVSMLIHLKVDGSLSLSIFENDLSRVAAGESRLVVRHLAAAPPVDVLAAGEVVFEALANGGERSADLPAGDVSASLVPTGEDGPTVIGPADLQMLEGAALIVYGVGSFEDGTMNVVTESITGLDSAPNAVNTGNSAVIEASVGVLAAAAFLVVMGLLVLTRLTARAGRLKS